MGDLLKTSTSNCIAHYCPPGSTIIVGFSGGPDSVALTHLLVSLREQLGITIIAAHLNHGWHSQATEIANWCVDWCKQQGISCIVGHVGTYKDLVTANGSQEDLGRQLRQEFFADIAQQYSATAIALAHHCDDQIETMLIRCIRGSSLQGLTGMRIANDRYLRPLLSHTKQQIYDYLAENNLTYCIDPTNDTDDYLRNRIRHHVIPAMQAADARAIQGLTKTMDQLQQVSDWFNEYCKSMLESLADSKTHLRLKALQSQDPIVRKQILLQWFIDLDLPHQPTTAWLNEIDRFIMNPRGGSHKVHPQWQIKKQGSVLWIENP